MIGTCSICRRVRDLTVGLCTGCYKSESKYGDMSDYPGSRDWVNPLVCVCDEPDARPDRDAGMCQVCKRKPLALMKPRPMVPDLAAGGIVRGDHQLVIREGTCVIPAAMFIEAAS